MDSVLYIYGYVNGNPVSLSDPYGLTAEDIEKMRKFAKCTQPDIDIPDFEVVPTGNPDLRGYTYPYPYLVPRLSDTYMKELSPSERFDLYDTIVHESVHYNFPWYRRGSSEYLNKVHRNNNEIVRKRTQPWERKIKSGDTKCPEPPPPPQCP